jgi:hypothetical protein
VYTAAVCSKSAALARHITPFFSACVTRGQQQRLGASLDREPECGPFCYVPTWRPTSDRGWRGAGRQLTVLIRVRRARGFMIRSYSSVLPIAAFTTLDRTSSPALPPSPQHTPHLRALLAASLAPTPAQLVGTEPIAAQPHRDTAMPQAKGASSSQDSWRSDSWIASTPRRQGGGGSLPVGLEFVGRRGWGRRTAYITPSPCAAARAG